MKICDKMNMTHEDLEKMGQLRLQPLEIVSLTERLLGKKCMNFF